MIFPFVARAQRCSPKYIYIFILLLSKQSSDSVGIWIEFYGRLALYVLVARHNTHAHRHTPQAVATAAQPILLYIFISYKTFSDNELLLLCLFMFIWMRWRIYDLFRFRPRRFHKIASHSSATVPFWVGSIKFIINISIFAPFRSCICLLGTLDSSSCLLDWVSFFFFFSCVCAPWGFFAQHRQKENEHIKLHS